MQISHPSQKVAAQRDSYHAQIVSSNFIVDSFLYVPAQKTLGRKVFEICNQKIYFESLPMSLS